MAQADLASGRRPSARRPRPRWRRRTAHARPWRYRCRHGIRTGASLMPSPTKASFVFCGFSASSFSTRATLSPGSSLAVHLVDAQLRPPPGRPPSRASPVSMTVRLTPAPSEPGDWPPSRAASRSSEITMCAQRTRRSRATWMMVPAHCGSRYSHMLQLFHQSAVAGRPQVMPSTFAVMPWPLISCDVRHARCGRFLFRTALCRLLADGMGRGALGQRRATRTASSSSHRRL